MNKLTILFLFVCTIGIAQKNKQKEKEVPVAVELTLKQKDSIIRIVYNRMYDASGKNDLPPSIKITNKKSQVASYTPSKNLSQIDIENEAFDVCNSFGDRRDDALAFLISHEVGHHLTHDFWNGNYQDFEIKIKDSLLLKYGIKSDTIASEKQTLRTLKEIKADEKGSILRYLAGYSSENLTEKLFDAIYSKYTHLSDTSYCYPPLQERIRIANIGDSMARIFASIFEMANNAVLIKDYDVAISYYNALLHEFKYESREVYNNIGVIYYLKAMELASEKFVKFIYPVEIDLESRVKPKVPRGENPLVIKYLNEASGYFEKATRLDREYSTGFLNRASVLCILGEDFDLANSNGKSAIKLARNDFEKQNAQLVLALINLKSEDGNKEKALKTIENLISQGNQLAILNKAIVENKTWSELPFVRPLSQTEAIESNAVVSYIKTKEQIQNISSYRDFTQIVGKDKPTTIEFGNPTQTMVTQNLEYSKLFMIDSKYLFLSTESNYEGATSLGIKMGSTEQELTEKYGLPSNLIPSAQGWVYHYPKSSMIVVIDSNKKVSKWMIYIEI